MRTFLELSILTWRFATLSATVSTFLRWSCFQATPPRSIAILCTCSSWNTPFGPLQTTYPQLMASHKIPKNRVHTYPLIPSQMRTQASTSSPFFTFLLLTNLKKMCSLLPKTPSAYSLETSSLLPPIFLPTF